MPAGRFRRYNRKPRVSRRKKPMAKKKVDRRQSRAIDKIERQLYTKCWSTVSRVNIPVGPVSGSSGFGTATAYIQPLSCALEQGATDANRVHDSAGKSLEHFRKWLWGTSVMPPQAPSGSPLLSQWFGASRIKTTYCSIDYRLHSNEDSLAQVCVAVIQPVKAVADQVTKAHNMKLAFKPSATGTTYDVANPGSQSFLTRDLDYSVGGFPKGTPGASISSTIYNLKFNPQLWKVRYQRNHNMQGGQTSSTAQAIVTDTKNAPDEQFGRIKLRMNTTLRAGSNNLVGVDSTQPVDGYATAATYQAIPNEEQCYLVVISNDNYGDQSINMSTKVDYTHQFYNTNITSM